MSIDPGEMDRLTWLILTWLDGGLPGLASEVGGLADVIRTIHRECGFEASSFAMFRCGCRSGTGEKKGQKRAKK